MRMIRRLGLTGLLATGCYSGLGADGDGNPAGSGANDDDGGGSATGPDDGPEQGAAVPAGGMRRLSTDEYDNTLRDLLLDESGSGSALLPADPRTPFDNDLDQQIASQALIEGAYLLAGDAATRLLGDAARRDQVVGCIPDGAADANCFTQFIDRFGRRALRRPLTDAERTDFLALLDYATEAGDFYVAVDTAIRTFLQEPEFLYRVEVGEPVPAEPGLFRLKDHEVGTRMSYFLLGTTPPDWLLDRADAGELADADGVRGAAVELLKDPRAKARIARFHALWLGYEALPESIELSAAMREESDKLVERVVFEDEPYSELFLSSSTWIDDYLAEHYGLPLPGTSAWVDYGDSGRAGILSHGSFLSAFPKFGDTSPTQRGILIKTRLFCQEIPPPPPGVSADDKPPATEDAFCKEDVAAVHSQGECGGCHMQMDPIGFGLENYDQTGRYRTHETDNPETPQDESTCEIAGKGSVPGIGEFRGPAELAGLMFESGLVERCVVTQLYRFAMGRAQLDANDTEFIDVLQERAAAPGFHFSDLALEFVAQDGFRFRREETLP